MIFKQFELQETQLQKSKNLWKAHVLSANEICLLVITFIFSLEFVLQDIALFCMVHKLCHRKNSWLETGYEESYPIRKKSRSAERFYNSLDRSKSCVKEQIVHFVSVLCKELMKKLFLKFENNLFFLA